MNDVLFLDCGGLVNLDGGGSLRADPRGRARPMPSWTASARRWHGSPRGIEAGDAMDWYLIGRILGVVFWPTLIAFLIYAIGWAASNWRQPHIARTIRLWSGVAAFLGFAATLFFTGRDLLKYTGVLG